MKLFNTRPDVLILLSQVIFTTGILAAPRPENLGAASRIVRRNGLDSRSTANILHQSHPHRNVTSFANTDAFGKADTFANDQSANWGGAVILSPPSGETFSAVSAQWQLPTVSPPPGDTSDGTWSSAEWVGIDGYTWSSAILQAGTLSTVTVSGGVTSTTVQIWYEWFPQPLITVDSFAVNAGDTVSTSVTATSSTTGTVVITNLSSGETFTIDISAPDSSSALGGQNAEWILEDVSSGGLVAFSDYTPTFFENCVATSQTQSVGLSGSTLLDMAQNGVVLSTAQENSDSELLMTYTG